jgi:HD-GYP domain-containing protein (c-di-GMP phosphodiesterase class II)
LDLLCFFHPLFIDSVRLFNVKLILVASPRKTKLQENLSYDVGKDLHYKKSVTALGNQKTITCTEDIYADNGAKLVAKGTKVDSKVYASLVKHKLQKDLDESIALEDPITVSIVTSDIEALISSSQTLSKLNNAIPEATPIKDFISEHIFPENIALKLTVAKSEHNNLYNHSLVVLCLSYYLASMAELDNASITSTLLAALFHDIGLLHIDPDLFETNKRLSDDDRKFLHVHVIISHVLLNKYEPYQAGISDAILEHHERLDGSGYPSGKHSAEISIPGQVLAIAEVMASKFNDQGECLLTEELSLLLNLNNHKLSPEIYKHWLWLFNDNGSDNDEHESYSDSELLTQSRQLNKIIKEWQSIIQRLPNSDLIEFIGNYIKIIDNNFAQAGMMINDLENLTQIMEQDKTVKLHFHIIQKESNWQLNNLITELSRRNLYQRAQQDTQLGPWLNAVIQFSNREII